MKVFFYVQHLLGIGHLRRAATLARTLEQAGFEVTLASGGKPVEGYRVLQLPPASSDASFLHLLDEHGNPVDDAWKRRRREALLAAYAAAAPDVLLIELFPFGRRQMRFELLPLLDQATAATPRPLVVCSVRDLIQAKPEREKEIVECFEHFYDRLLVHGDPRLARFERSFGAAARIAGKLHYTGYVVQEMPEAESDAGANEVLVSAGGGAVGQRLLESAIAARALSSLRERTWRVLAGINAENFEALQARAGRGLIVERFRNDFTLRLRNCVLSVSQAGYNTVLETLQARARAVVVPFAGVAESEQSLRANLLAERGLLEVVEEAALTPATLAAAIDRAAARPRPAPGAIDLDGARRSAELLREWLA
ncbi:MAG TPA: glycosyltransferase [Burkholderiales bacterium]|nr:glycosyltransferase [Burkholderiales bacterium]